MNCPRCGLSIEEHDANDCLDLWILEAIFGWEKSISSYEGNFYPEGSYFVLWQSQDKEAYLISQAFDKDGNNLRATKDNPLGIMYEFVEYGKSYQFSTDIDAAWKVVEKLNSSGHIVEIINDCVAWSVQFINIDTDKKYTSDWKCSLETQICRAALMASQ